VEYVERLRLKWRRRHRRLLHDLEWSRHVSKKVPSVLRQALSMRTHVNCSFRSCSERSMDHILGTSNLLSRKKLCSFADSARRTQSADKNITHSEQLCRLLLLIINDGMTATIGTPNRSSERSGKMCLPIDEVGVGVNGVATNARKRQCENHKQQHNNNCQNCYFYTRKNETDSLKIVVVYGFSGL